MPHLKSKDSRFGPNRRKAVNQSQLWLECAQRGLTSDPLVKSALQQLSINPYDLECAQLIQHEIRSMDIQDILRPDQFRRTNPARLNQVSGSIRLGRVQHSNVWWGIHPQALTEHMVLIGRTGGGKTTVIKALVRQLLERRSV